MEDIDRFKYLISVFKYLHVLVINLFTTETKFSACPEEYSSQTLNVPPQIMIFTGTEGNDGKGKRRA